jgi:hypothetical protein
LRVRQPRKRIRARQPFSFYVIRAEFNLRIGEVALGFVGFANERGLA